MIRDYRIVSPSLDGVLRHESLSYDGLKRPEEMAMIFDRPAGPRKDEASDPEKRKIVERYFHDLYGVIMKKLSEFTMESEPPADLGIKIQAMIQELIKVKRLLSETGTKKGE